MQRDEKRLTYEFRTPGEAAEAALSAAAHFPDPGRAYAALLEVALNAVEHGNLEIGAAQKEQWLRQGRLEQEIARRLALPEYAGRRGRIEITRSGRCLSALIVDQGPGFDWRAACRISSQDASTALCGRGMLLARSLSGLRLTYLSPGNRVIASAPVKKLGAARSFTLPQMA